MGPQVLLDGKFQALGFDDLVVAVQVLERAVLGPLNSLSTRSLGSGVAYRLTCVHLRLRMHCRFDARRPLGGRLLMPTRKVRVCRPA